MAWIYLTIAGVLEVAWAIGLSKTEGFTKLWPSVWTALGLAGSMWLLALAARTIPIGTAYPIWTGIGAVGTAILGMILLKEPATAMRILFIVMIVGGIVGLKATAKT